MPPLQQETTPDAARVAVLKKWSGHWADRGWDLTEGVAMFAHGEPAWCKLIADSIRKLAGGEPIEAVLAAHRAEWAAFVRRNNQHFRLPRGVTNHKMLPTEPALDGAAEVERAHRLSLEAA